MELEMEPVMELEPVTGPVMELETEPEMELETVVQGHLLPIRVLYRIHGK